jgi:C1A family cysteine protease
MNKKTVIGIFLLFAVIAILVIWTLQSSEMIQEGHLPLYQEITAIKNRLTVNITEANFTNPVRVCDFYELREEDSEDYFQTTVNYWVFQHGQEEHGDIEAFVEIYNVPNRTDLYIVEVTRNCWYELTVSLDGATVVVFPTITRNELSLGYMTFEVAPK